MDEPSAAIAAVVGLGVAAQWVATRLRIPSILLLLGVGLAAGPLFGLLDPDELLGDLLFPVVSMGVGLLLFEGGIGLHRSELGSWRGVLFRLLSVGVVITGIIAAVAAHTVGGLPWGASIVFGAIMTVTGPTVIIPLLRQQRLRPRVARVLRWEGIWIDAVGATLAIVALEVVVVAGDGAVEITQAVLTTAVVGSGLGLLAGIGLAWFLGHRMVSDHMQNAVIIAVALAVFALANHFREEAGLFATTVLGITLANQRRAPVRHVIEFQESLGVLLIGGIFVVLGARVEAADLQDNLLPGLGVLAVLVILARPLAVAASTWRSRLSRNERLYLAGLAPRGIVAASVSALFGLKLEEAGIAGGTDLSALTFVVVAGSVVVYGLGAGPLSRRLRVNVPEPTGVALIGAPPWVVQLGRCLQQADVGVLVISTDEEEIADAQRADLLVYNGRLAHKDLEETVEALGIKLALAVSEREELNEFGSERFNHLLGRANVYGMPRSSEERSESHGGAGGHDRRELGQGLVGNDLKALVASGVTVEMVRREDFDPDRGTFFPLLSAKNGRPTVVSGSVDESAVWVIGLRVPTPDVVVPEPGPDESLAE
ncbi:cation:proton antiporter [Actinomarinicola tropica]|uniref:Cation/H+ exchanger transmembrane domain-containing protein n=1 Tax=Actinomarinicola tropica TaxID=2789776 RepID=A0A5Q2RJ32_9ACTN|nr:sodium:proton antiporter [Actinomarinicola tropica]QGG96779.1 hypothetical protein GH723_17685 [Actinomarinicola tropica]